MDHAYTSAGLMERFGEKAARAMRDGQPAADFARLAATFAFKAYPEMRHSLRWPEEHDLYLAMNDMQSALDAVEVAIASATSSKMLLAIHQECESTMKRFDALGLAALKKAESL